MTQKSLLTAILLLISIVCYLNVVRADKPTEGEEIEEPVGTEARDEVGCFQMSEWKCFSAPEWKTLGSLILHYHWLYEREQLQRQEIQNLNLQLDVQEERVRNAQTAQRVLAKSATTTGKRNKIYKVLGIGGLVVGIVGGAFGFGAMVSR